MTIEPVTPERLSDLADLFDRPGDQKWCWCTWFRIRNADFSTGSAAGHRALLTAAIADGDERGQAPGLLAYDGDGRPVGWVSVGPRTEYERLRYSRVLAPVDDTPVWSIVCFVVGKQARGQGVATALLEAAVAYARAHGATMVEAYPVEVADGQRIDPAQAFKGTLAMFEHAGFEVVARRRATPSTASRPIVRRSL